MVRPQRLLGRLRSRSPRRGATDRQSLHQVFRIIPVARLRTRRGRRQSVGGKQQSGVSKSASMPQTPATGLPTTGCQIQQEPGCFARLRFYRSFKRRFRKSSRPGWGGALYITSARPSSSFCITSSAQPEPSMRHTASRAASFDTP